MLPVILLLLFPIVLMFHSTLGYVMVVAAIVLLYRGRANSARPNRR